MLSNKNFIQKAFRQEFFWNTCFQLSELYLTSFECYPANHELLPFYIKKVWIYNLFLTLKIKYTIHQYSPGFRILVLLRFWLQEIKLFQVLILKRARNFSWCRNFARNWVLATNTNFLVPISLHPCGVNLRYFKLWTLLDQKL